MKLRIHELREKAGLTQAQVAQMLCCSQQIYSHYELNQRDIPLDILIRLAEYYDTSIDYLMNRTDKPELLQ